jgi:hypothetical protein
MVVSMAVRSAGGVRAGAVEQRLRAVGLGQHRREQVSRLDVRVVARNGQTLGIGQGLLEGGGQLVETHGILRTAQASEEVGHQFQGAKQRRPAASASVCA